MTDGDQPGAPLSSVHQLAAVVTRRPGRSRGVSTDGPIVTCALVVGQLLSRPAPQAAIAGKRVALPVGLTVLGRYVSPDDASMLASHSNHRGRSSRLFMLVVLAALVLLAAVASYSARVSAPPTHRQGAQRGQPAVMQEHNLGNIPPECRPVSGFTC